MSVPTVKTIDGLLPVQTPILKTPIYARLPANPRRGMVVIHEIFGRQPEIDAVVDRFAERGYAAVAPDLLASAPKFLCLVRAFRAIASGQGPQIEQIVATRKWLCEQTGITPEHVGVIGFCMGGGFALAAGKGWGAVSTNYGEVPPTEVLRGCAPVIGCYGGKDKPFRDKAGVLKERLTALNIPVETHVFPEVGHAFLTNGNHPIASFLSQPLLHVKYNPAVADQAWETIFGFFDKHLQ